MEESTTIKDKESIFKSKLEELFDEFYLNNFQRTMIMTFIKKHMNEINEKEFGHARNWLLNKINNIPSIGVEGQQGCPDVIPGLQGFPVW